MLFSMACIMLLGMFLGFICKKIHLPALIGMIATGIILGPYALNVIDSSILDVSADLRKIALIIILTRAGLSLNISDLKKVGRSAVLMCFVPATFEIVGMVLLAPPLLGISRLEAAIMGAVVAAVSPAVIVPKMLKLMEEGYGTKQGIPQLILAGASVDDIFVIVLFSVFTGFAKGDGVSAVQFVKIPVSVILGIAIGMLAGYFLALYFEKVHIRDTAKVLILLSVSFLLTTGENLCTGVITYSSLIAIMCVGIALQKKREYVAKHLATKFSKLWVAAEILLFVLVGATIDLRYVEKAGGVSIALIFGVLLFRMVGVFFCMLGTELKLKERFFCMLGYLPKATVQAAMGGMPLSMGLACGKIVLTVAVLAILITAPLGAFLIEVSYKHLLVKE